MQNITPPQIALIGPTAGGKSALAMELARKTGGRILSLDSLALYREIDIASAKPTPRERSEVIHYGIDILGPDEPFDVTRYIALYKKVRRRSLEEGFPLFIVGGSGFYLKVLLEGISPMPPIDETTRQRVATLLKHPADAYSYLADHAPVFARTLSETDRYRLEKALLILIQTGTDPMEYFSTHPPRPVIDETLPLFEIERPREELRERIRRRTDAMLDEGLIDEVAALEYRYGRTPQSMKAIGIIEVLEYFDGRLTYEEMREKIVVNTARLAKRQRTFNRSQFTRLKKGSPETLKREIESLVGLRS